MQANRYSIDFKGLSFGMHEFKFELTKALFEGYEECEVLDGRGEAMVELQRSETMLQLNISIQAVVEVECDRCLEPCPVEIDFEAPLIVKFSDEEELANEYDGEVMWLGTTASEVDLAHYIYESIILSLPYQRIHADGECNPEMMSRFKIITSAEFEQLEGADEGANEGADEAESEGASKSGDIEASDALPASEIAKLKALKELMEKE